MSKLRLTLLCGFAAALLASCSSVSSLVKEEEALSPPTSVQFSFDAVSPQTVTIAADGNVTWLNNGVDVVGFVIFPGSIAASFRCQDLHPYLTRLEDGAFRSPPITGLVSERAQLPCALAPGSYDYEIWLFGEGFGGEGLSATPQKVLRARIVVE